MTLGAIVLTGGASRRMGRDKAAVLWRGVPAVVRVHDLAVRAGAGVVISVGRTDYGLPLVCDAAPLGGPVGGILAGAAALRARGCDRGLVLAVDAPTIRPDDLRPLLEPGGAGAAYEGLHLPLVVSLSALPAAAPADWPIGRLIRHAGVHRPSCPSGSGARLRGANTEAERQALLRELDAYEAAAATGGAPA